ncbi:butyrate kinase [Vagococcus acidifermentans]|uniref:Probable butyrate kinase n=1 Tax=Vagococcus acidifermentans TaxID=564710 RepID=A0A430B2R1_9ENTE|nr:butyrate kinase [Vagococcus acidifermentans]RSU14625.1 butyrate kinase [Vagococcus acidifermentans]
MAETYKFLIINPGSTSTKISVFENDQEQFHTTINHSPEEIRKYHEIYDQFDFRLELILDVLKENNIALSEFSAVIARGGNMRPVVGGTYEVNDEMLKDLKIGVMGSHASNLGGGLAHAIASDLNIKSYVVDPVIVDELEPLARFSGTPLISRKSKDHPLNQRAVGRIAAQQANKKYEDMNYIIAHLGGGISIAAHKKGKIVDVNNSLNGDGPFSPERTGGLPFGSVIDLCYSGEYTKDELMKKLVGHGGLVAYLGTNDGRDVTRMIEEGNKEAETVYHAMAYQISKEIGAMASVLKGQVDGILLTGGLAYDKRLMGWIEEYVSFIAPVQIFPGEKEMEALALGVLRVLNGKETIQVYPNK